MRPSPLDPKKDIMESKPYKKVQKEITKKDKEAILKNLVNQYPERTHKMWHKITPRYNTKTGSHLEAPQLRKIWSHLQKRKTTGSYTDEEIFFVVDYIKTNGEDYDKLTSAFNKEFKGRERCKASLISCYKNHKNKNFSEAAQRQVSTQSVYEMALIAAKKIGIDVSDIEKNDQALVEAYKTFNIFNQSQQSNSGKNDTNDVQTHLTYF